MNLQDYITEVPDWPKPGIVFRDITTLLSNGPAYHHSVGLIANQVGKFCMAAGIQYEAVAAIESRGFFFGAPIATSNAKQFIPIRKAGKLPRATHSETYNLEYGTAALEIHQDSIVQGTPIVLIDDVLATGGTAAAAVRLLRKAGARVLGCVFLIEIPILGGRKVLDVPVAGVIQV